jgi:hypothetical protein
MLNFHRYSPFALVDALYWWPFEGRITPSLCKAKNRARVAHLFVNVGEKWAPDAGLRNGATLEPVLYFGDLWR